MYPRKQIPDCYFPDMKLPRAIKEINFDGVPLEAITSYQTPTSSLPSSAFHYTMASSNAYNMLRLDDKYTSQYIQHSSNDYHRGSSMLVEQNSSVPKWNYWENSLEDIGSYISGTRVDSWFNYSKSSNTAGSMLRLNYKCTSQYQSSNDYHRGSSMLVDAKWNSGEGNYFENVLPSEWNYEKENNFEDLNGFNYSEAPNNTYDMWGLNNKCTSQFVQHSSNDYHKSSSMEPTPKRMRVENNYQYDDWSLAAVIQFMKQHLLGDEDNVENMNKEVLSEVPTTAVPWNSTADNEGLKSPMAEPLVLGQPPEVYLISDDDESMENDDSISHHQEPNIVSEMGRVETSALTYEAIFSPQSFASVLEESPINQGQNTELVTQAEHETSEAKSALANSNHHCGRKLEDLKVSCVSLTDSFSAEQIEAHLCSLNPSLNSNAGKKLGEKICAPAVGENTCQLCVEDKLTFAAPSISCASCGAQIIHKSGYYWSQDAMGERYCFCTKCFKNSCRSIPFIKGSILKTALEKDRNTEKSEEPWVQCDKCEQWQHQICALYNSEQDLKGDVKYTCPFCRLKEIEANVHAPVHPLAYGAKNLPRTKLSDHIEQRLFRSLEQELGKKPDEVLGASELSVRVVLAANKQLKVKQQFLDLLPGESYPTEFPYNSKVILLFQKIDGADVCLFAMYVQEFGSECSNPNKRSIYISYIDSVKYFRPEIRTPSGVALRTFIYHEVLIGYLDYCKKLGFEICYIWACPSSKGDDYILNCHPKNQRRPNSNKLVQWYKKMIRKAKDDNVIVGSTNFYDKFFVPRGGSKVTAARLPCFDGDYWSAAIEDILQTIGKSSGRKTGKGHRDLSVNTSKDTVVMHELGHKILSVKEEIMVVQLQFNCTNCNKAILSGGCWSCNQCSKFHLCSRCLEVEQQTTGMAKHEHPLSMIPVKTSADINIEDGVLVNNIFDDRHSFLNFCEENHYQFDTLRRAKHSTMMILFHLHTKNLKGLTEMSVNLLAHASQCNPTKDNPCSYSRCLQIKKLFLHNRECKVRAGGGCIWCKKIWRMLYLHSKHCMDSYCKVPRCMDIKDCCMKKTMSGIQSNNLLDSRND